MTSKRTSRPDSTPRSMAFPPPQALSLKKRGRKQALPKAETITTPEWLRRNCWRKTICRLIGAGAHGVGGRSQQNSPGWPFSRRHLPLCVHSPPYAIISAIGHLRRTSRDYSGEATCRTSPCVWTMHAPAPCAAGGTRRRPMARCRPTVSSCAVKVTIDAMPFGLSSLSARIIALGDGPSSPTLPVGRANQPGLRAGADVVRSSIGAREGRRRLLRRLVHHRRPTTGQAGLATYPEAWHSPTARPQDSQGAEFSPAR